MWERPKMEPCNNYNIFSAYSADKYQQRASNLNLPLNKNCYLASLSLFFNACTGFKKKYLMLHGKLLYSTILR